MTMDKKKIRLQKAQRRKEFLGRRGNGRRCYRTEGKTGAWGELQTIEKGGHDGSAIRLERERAYSKKKRHKGSGISRSKRGRVSQTG